MERGAGEREVVRSCDPAGLQDRLLRTCVLDLSADRQALRGGEKRDMQMKLRFKIYGRVQGVFFRSAARKMMDKLWIKGWVRNCEDDCVETEVEGEEEAVAEYRKWCAKGPAGAKVEKVDEF